MIQLDWPGKRQVARHVHAQMRSQSECEVGLHPDSLGWVVLPGDNLPHLARLASSCRASFDLIYLDPPYNGSYELTAYDDATRDARDEAWLAEVLGPTATGLNIHERWLSLLYARLLAMAPLLSADGVVAVSIDSHEAHHMLVLLNEIFPGHDPAISFAWPHTVQLGHVDEIPVRMNYLLVSAAGGQKPALPTAAVGSTPQAREEVAAELGGAAEFETPKPQSLLRYLLNLGAGPSSLILDPYAGSGSLGVATTQSNQADGGHRICVLIERSQQALSVLGARGRALSAGAERDRRNRQ